MPSLTSFFASSKEVYWVQVTITRCRGFKWVVSTREREKKNTLS